MRVRRVWTDDEGSALVETFLLAVVLLVPMAWILLAAFTVQQTAYAAAAAAREAGRAYVTMDGTSSAAARSRAQAAVRIVMQDFDVRPATGTDIDGVLTSGSFVTVTVRARAPLPFLPAFLDVVSVPVEAQALAVVDEYR